MVNDLVSQIQPQYVTLDQLLYGRLFRIPQYQRMYSWRKKERQDLFRDINRTAESGKPHYMATIVGLRRENTNILTRNHQTIEVVDGQQRITTLVLLLKAIAKILDRSTPAGERIGQELDETVVKPDKALLLLQTNHDISHYFADYLRTGEHPSSGSARTVADRELLSAMEECEEYVNNWLSRNKSLETLVSLLKNQLTFVLHEIGDESLVYTVFEVLNSRGLVVSWFDRLKSMLMATVFDINTGSKDEFIDEVHLLWTDIYRCVGLRLGLSTESLRFAATLRATECPSRPLGEEEAALLLSSQSASGPTEVLETTKWLKDVTEAVDMLTADHRKNAVTDIVQARLVATALHLRGDLSGEEKDEILHRWENVTFRIYGMYNKDARTAVGDYVRLAWRIVNKNLNATKIKEELSAIGAAFPIAGAVKSLQSRDCYTARQEDLRYFFYRYEEHLADEAGLNFDNEQWSRIWEASAANSIEHILPQSSEEKWIHWLGNLTILPPRLNSRLGAVKPKGKAGAYTKTGLLVTQQVVAKLPRWGKLAIERREVSLLKWARQEWAD